MLEVHILMLFALVVLFSDVQYLLDSMRQSTGDLVAMMGMPPSYTASNGELLCRDPSKHF